MVRKRPSFRTFGWGAFISLALALGYTALDFLTGVVTSESGSIRGYTPQFGPDYLEGMGAIGYIRKQETHNEPRSDDARHLPALSDRPSEAPPGD